MAEENEQKEVEDDDDFRAVIIDCGSWTCKVGLAGDDFPSSVFRSLVGRPRAPGILIGPEQKHVYVGDEAEKKRGCLSVSCPVERGIVTRWNDLEQIWRYAYYEELAVKPEERPVLLTEPILNPQASRERMAKVMFETLSVPALFVASQPALTLYAQGRTEGLVVHSGHTLTQIVPVYEGYYIPHAVFLGPLAGRDLSDHLVALLAKKGYSLCSPRELGFVNDIKESLCFVAEDYWGEMRCDEVERTFECDNKDTICIGKERFRCPELIFRPDLAGLEVQGIVDLAFKAVMKCPPEVRRDMFAGVVLGGGSTMFPGFGGRMKKDLIALAPLEWPVTVLPHKAEDRKISTWVGGSIIAIITQFQEMWVSSEEYEENGPSVVHEKCQL